MGTVTRLAAGGPNQPAQNGAGAPTAQPASQNVALWDTLAPAADNFSDRSGWIMVPDDLLQLEKDPPKASSDPGYYGREYAFRGDAVVETPTLSAVFVSAKGCVRLSSRSPVPGQNQPRTVELWPPGSTRISRIDILRNADDEIVLQAAFAGSDSPPHTAVFAFDKTGVMEVKPGENWQHVRLKGPLAYGIAPAFVGDDLVYGGSEHPVTNTGAVPAENLFLGLLPGEASELGVSWPPGKQRLNLLPAEDPSQSGIESVDFDPDALSFYVETLSAPGIWHKETLTPAFLEKDVKIEWKRPFPARWKTLLYEEELKTTYAFRQSKGTVWRGVAGSYNYPVWFEGEEAYYRLGKKVQPKGESLIYFLEGRDTPLSVMTPADMLKQTLGRRVAEPILDVAGRKLRTHHRRGATGVRRACTCGCTEAIQAVFEAGEEGSRKDEIQGALDDMIYFIHCHVERIGVYQQFADGLLKTLEEKKGATPDLTSFLEGLEEIARQIPRECEVQKEHMKDFAYADELTRKTMALTGGKDPAHLKAYMELLKAWRDMGGAQDYVVAKCHVVTRELYQAAGYGCANFPAALPLAEEIRARCRQLLRNPDGYEVWADY